jgi:hypothetical protein
MLPVKIKLKISFYCRSTHFFLTVLCCCHMALLLDDDDDDVIPGSRTNDVATFLGAFDVKLDGENLTDNGKFSHASPNRFMCKYASIP